MSYQVYPTQGTYTDRLNTTQIVVGSSINLIDDTMSSVIFNDGTNNTISTESSGISLFDNGVATQANLSGASDLFYGSLAETAFINMQGSNDYGSGGSSIFTLSGVSNTAQDTLGDSTFLVEITETSDAHVIGGNNSTLGGAKPR